MTKLYLVRNEAKTEHVGFIDYAEAFYCKYQAFPIDDIRTEVSRLADAWVEIYGDEECTITEIEV